MKSLKTNYFRVLWHWITHINDYTRPHEVKFMVVDGEMHYHCRCGFDKPRRIYACTGV